MNKKIKINVFKVMFIFLYCVFSFIVFNILKNIEYISYYDWLKKINCIIIAVLIIQLIIIKKFKYNIFSISGMFLIFSYVFHLSYQFLVWINYDFGGMSYGIPHNRYGTEIFRNAVEYSLISIIALFLGMILFMPKNMNNNTLNKKKKSSTNFNKKIGIMTILISLPIDVYLLLERIRGMMEGGYLGSIEAAGGSISLFISYLLLPGVFLYITGIKDNIKKSRRVAIIYILYKLIGTFTGLRAYTILQVILFLYLYFKTVEKVRLKTLIYGGIGSYLILSWFIIIRNTRATGIRLGDLLDIFNLKNNVILNSLSEFGFTINVVCITFFNKVEHVFGGQLYYSILAIIPKVSYIFPEYSSYTIYNSLDLYKYGSSFIADFYFDFGSFGIVACILYGVVIQIIANYIDKSLINGKYFNIAILLPTIIDILFTVRSGTYKIPRVLVYTSVIFLIIKYFTKIMERDKYEYKK